MAGSIAVRRLFGEILFRDSASNEIRRFDRSMDAAKESLKGMDKGTKDLKKSQRELKTSTGDLTKSFFIASTAFNTVKNAASYIWTNIKDGIREGIDISRDFNESQSKLLRVFESIQDETLKVRDSLTEAYGYSKNEATQLLGTTGDLLVGLGFEEKQALSLSRRVQELASDTASFSNIEGGAKRASEALTKMLLGEREMAKSLGIAIGELDIKQWLIVHGKDKLTGLALRQAKAEASLELAYFQSRKAMGDYSATQDQLANRQRTYKAVLEDIKMYIGDFVTPKINNLTGAMIKNAKAVRDWISDSKNIDKINGIIDKGGRVVKDLFSPALRELAVLGKDLKDVFNDLFGGMFEGKRIFESLGTGAYYLGKGLGILVKQLRLGLQVGVMVFKVFKNIFNIWASIYKLFKGDFKGAFNGLKDIGKDFKKTAIDIKNAAVSYYGGVREVIVDAKKNNVTGRNTEQKEIYKSMPSFDDIKGKRAEGGHVKKGKKYLVGEKEPEVFTPFNSGEITPFSKMGAKVIISSIIDKIVINVKDNDDIAYEIEKNIYSALDRISPILRAKLGLAVG